MPPINTAKPVLEKSNENGLPEGRPSVTDEVSPDGTAEADGRIEGEFYYATKTRTITGDLMWAVFRKGDDKFKPVFGSKLMSARRIQDFDNTARHFIEAGAQAERERFERLATELADHTQDLTLSTPGQETSFWTAYGLPNCEDGATGRTPIEAMENLAANQKESNQ